MGSLRSNSSLGFIPVIWTKPPNGIGAIWKVVPLCSNPSKVGPKPMEKRSTRMPHSRATRKCPPSCNTMSRPSPTIATRIDSITARVARAPERREPSKLEGPAPGASGRPLRGRLRGQEAQHRTQQERHRTARARSDHVDPQLLRAPLEHRLEQQARAAGADDHRKRG